MTIPVVLEIIIGMIFVWYFLALAVMAIQEWWAAATKARAVDLQKAIRAMLEDPQQYSEAQANINSLVGQFYQHPLIESLSQPLKIQKKRVNLRAKGQIQHQSNETSIRRWLPSYIPTRTFALALFDVITTAGTKESAIQKALGLWQNTVDTSIASLQADGSLPAQTEDAWKELQPMLSSALAEFKEVVQPHLSQSELVTELNRKLDKLKADHPQLEPVLASLKPEIDQLPQFLFSDEVALDIARLAAKNPAAQRVLQNLYQQAARTATQGEGRLAAFRKNLEEWFDNTMGRASEWYKQKARILSFIFGIIVAVVLNIDSIAVATALYRQPTLREQVLAQAEAQAAKEGAETGVSPSEVSAALQDLGLPVGWSFLDQTACADMDQLDVWIKVRTLCVVPGDTPKGIEADSGSEKAGLILLKLAGWALSGAMAAQGAPFWFDLMRKLLNVRSGGKDSS